MRMRDRNLRRAKPPKRNSFPVPGDSDDPRRTATLAILYAELARAQVNGDREAVDYARDTIREFLTATPDDCVDMPLFPRQKRAKRSRR